MPYVLPVATGQIRYPIVNVILVKPDNRLVHSPAEYRVVREKVTNELLSKDFFEYIGDARRRVGSYFLLLLRQRVK